MSNNAEDYLIDLGTEVLAIAKAAQQSAAKSPDAFEKGRQTALYEVLSLMKQQAQAFGLEDEAIGLKGANLEDLLNQGPTE